MKLNNIIVTKHRDNFRFKSLINEFEIELNQTGMNSLESFLELEHLEDVISDEEIFFKNVFNSYLENGSKYYISHNSQYHISSIELLQKCNLKCSHCYLGDKQKSTINLSKFKELVDSTIILGGYHIDLTGGELFLDRYLLDKLQYSRENNLKTTLTTNATLIDKNMADKLKRLQISSITTTLNGNKDEHEKIYGLKSYDKSIKALEYLSEEGLDIIINYMVYESNFDSRKKFEEEIKKKFNVVKVNFSPIKSLGHAKINFSLILPEIKRKEVNPYSCTQDITKGLTCMAGKSQVFIKSNGDVLPCSEFLDYKIGNIYEKKLEEMIWK